MSERCPYLEEGRIIKSCNASSTLLIPSIDRHEAYCSGDDHYRCQILLGHVMRAGKPKATGTQRADCMNWAEK